MVVSATLLVDEVLPELPKRQWALSFPFHLRFLFTSRPQLMGRVRPLLRHLELLQRDHAFFLRHGGKSVALNNCSEFPGSLVVLY